MYIFYNFVFALFGYPIGIVADKVGLKKTFIVGLALFAAVNVGMAVNSNTYIYFGLFFLYGIYAAATDGISKAWISNITDRRDTAQGNRNIRRITKRLRRSLSLPSSRFW